MTESPSIRVLLVDDSALVREGIRAVLAFHGAAQGIEVIGEAATLAEAVQQARLLQPDVVLLDIRLPDGSGLEACRQILRDRPETRVLVLTSYDDEALVYDAVISGAQGYLMKEIDPQALVQALVDAAAGKSVLAPEVTVRVLQLLRQGSTPGQSPELAALSGQERKVLALVAEGLTNKQVGERLALSENTVKNYLMSVFEKLQVKRRSQAAALYVKASAGSSGD